MSKNLIIVFLFVFSSVYAEKISLKVIGDKCVGYNVDVYYGSMPVSKQNNTGELNLYVENEDYSIREYIKNWKATSFTQQDHRITLSGDVDLKKLETTLRISVIYEIVNENVVAKQIELLQTNLPLLYYSVSTSLSIEEPSRFWSFDNVDNKGGVVHESYPAAGFFIGDTLAVGLLSDAGDKNLWTRNIRRRPSKGEIGFRALREICDANLYRIKADNKTVDLTLGEVSDFNNAVSQVIYHTPGIDDWKVYNQAKISKEQGVIVIQGKEVKDEIAGYRVPYQLKDGFYTIRFKHKSNKPITIRLWKGEGTENADIAGFHYQTDIPSSETEWTTQEETVFVANTENKLMHLLIAGSSLKKEDSFRLEIKDLEVIQTVGKEMAYHRLEQGKKEVKKIFIFATQAKPTLHDIRLSSQVYLADGLKFHGTIEEKCLYACYQMLMWITSRNNFNPLNVPSINYAPDMYNRDSFWSVMGVYDKDASEKIFNAWAATQTPEGGIGTIITPSMGSKEVKGNEATLEFLWFALVNHRLYGTPLPMDRIKKAFDYCINNFDPDKDGVCSSKFVLGQNDVVEYPDKTSGLSINQGMLAITLRVAQELGMPVSDEYIEKANQKYRDFYDKERGYILDNMEYKYSITLSSLLPEFVSWWLFDEPILTDEMVINTLNKVPSKNGYSPLIFHEKDLYFTMENKPFSPNMFWENGIYYNAGSWMREEICAYVAGFKHGWTVAEKRIKDRLTAEINTHPDEPFSHEFLPYNLSVPNCWWPSTRVFSWNVFVLRALEVAGMRMPEQDPLYHKCDK
jgi:hypothetical protein